MLQLVRLVRRSERAVLRGKMDLRKPVGVLFVILGALLVFYGLLVGEKAVADLGFNANAIWGGVMLIFGALMWFAAWRSAGKENR